MRAEALRPGFLFGVGDGWGVCVPAPAGTGLGGLGEGCWLFLRFATIAELCTSVLDAGEPVFGLLGLRPSTYYGYRSGDRWPRSVRESAAIRAALAELLGRTCAYLGRRPPEADSKFHEYVDCLFRYEEFLRFAPEPFLPLLGRAAAEVVSRCAGPGAVLAGAGLPLAVLAAYELFDSLGAEPVFGASQDGAAVGLWLARKYFKVVVASGKVAPVRAGPGLEGFRVACAELGARTGEKPALPYPVWIDALLALGADVRIGAAAVPGGRVCHHVVVRCRNGEVVEVDARDACLVA